MFSPQQPMKCWTCGFKWWTWAKDPEDKCPHCNSVNVHYDKPDKP